MKVSLQIEGGVAPVPALENPVELGPEDMAGVDTGKLRQLVIRAEEHKAAAPKKARGADRRTYTIALEDAGERHVVKLMDPLDDPMSHMVAQLRVQALHALRRRR